MGNLVTTTEAATTLRTSPKVVRRYIAEGRLVPRAKSRGADLLDSDDVAGLALALAEEAEAHAAELRRGVG